MGADMVLTMISHKTTVEPDLDKAKAAINALTEVDIDRDVLNYEHDMYAFDDILVEEGEATAAQLLLPITTRLHTIFEDVFAALDDREVSIWRLAGYTCYFTGGMTWGDAPTEASTIFGRIDECGPLGDLIFEAAGFEYMPTDTPVFVITEQETP